MCPTTFKDVFVRLCKKLCDLRAVRTVLASDLAYVVRKEFESVRERLATHDYLSFSSESRLRVVIDEAQILSDRSVMFVSIQCDGEVGDRKEAGAWGRRNIPLLNLRVPSHASPPFHVGRPCNPSYVRLYDQRIGFSLVQAVQDTVHLVNPDPEHFRSHYDPKLLQIFSLGVSWTSHSLDSHFLLGMGLAWT
jgi:hypothetical protein